MPGGFGVQLGKILVVFGAAIVVLGLILIAGVKFPSLGFGRLPGDIVYKGKNTSFYFPIVTCVAISVVLTFLFWLVSFFTKR
ncbi:MAG: DUF2905 domain-containing protein [Terriglobia bacterium]